jgi:Zn-finger nucleic acid-binding protein
MADCRNCGAPIGRIASEALLCPYCGTRNDPPPREVPVPVQVVHNVVQVVGDASARPLEFRCPHCRKRLVGVRAAQVELNGCSTCGGIWIDNASARSVLQSPEGVFAELAQRAAQNATKRQRTGTSAVCATCPALLDAVTTHGIDLDVCSEHGTWFDAYELAQLVRALRGEPPPHGAAPGRLIKCQVCKASLPADRANLTDEGLACDTCWRGRQNAVIAAGEEKTQRDGALAVGGALLGVAAVLLGAAADSRG